MADERQRPTKLAKRLRPKSAQTKFSEGNARARNEARLRQSLSDRQVTQRNRPRRPLASKVRSFESIGGKTLERYTRTSGKTICKYPTKAELKLQCTACPLPHDPTNLNCWANIKRGEPPPVLNAPTNCLFDIKTKQQLGIFAYKIQESWEKCRFTVGHIKVDGLVN